MSPIHLFSRLPRQRQRIWFVTLFLLTVILAIALRALDSHLQTPAAPAGIVSYEFAGDMESAQKIIASWRDERLAAAGISLGLDYLFLLAYSTTLALACTVLGQRQLAQHPRWATVGFGLAWASWLAGCLDAVENYALIQLLLDSNLPFWPTLAWASAVLKFALVTLAIVYCALSFAWTQLVPKK